VRAFHNVCRHRGSRICTESHGHGKSFVCPYHAWTYSTDGTLLGAGAMPCGFDKTQFGLKQIPAKVVHGMVMVYLGPGEAPDLSQVERDIGSVLSISDLNQAKLAACKTWDIRANWKLVAENFAECYHCGPAHPEYSSVMAVAQPGTTGAAAHKESFAQLCHTWQEHARTLGHPLAEIAPSPRTLHCCARFPVAEGKLSPSKNGEQIAPLMGQFRQNDGGVANARVHPCAYWINACDHAVLFRFTPVGAQRTIQEIAWLVHPDAVEGRDYQRDELMWLWNVTTDQDKRIIEDNQLGVNSSAYEPGPYSEVETACSFFVDWYLEQV
jgi:phenylpropionate dioxygenase-like ring-hydroxylating dioxygenase large terminal subunit